MKTNPRIVNRRKLRKCFCGLLAALLALGMAFALGGCTGGAPASDAGGSSAQADAGPTSPSGAEAAKTVDADLAGMAWNEVLAEAEGDTVTFCAWGSGGADAMVQQYWDYIKQRARAEYGITVEYVEDTAEDEQRFAADYENGIDATIDMFWGASASIGAMGAAGALWGDDGNNWAKKLPNSENLDWTATDVLYNGAMPTDGYQSQFMKVTPAMVCASDRYDASLAWDASREGDGGKTIFGLPHNLTELSLWVKKYPGKFTYLDLLGSGGFHGKQFVTSALYELTDDGSGGWKAVYDESDDARARSEKIQAHAEEWSAWASGSESAEEAFIEKAGYAWAYFNELEPNLFQGEGGAYYGADAYDMISRVNAGDIACSFTTCISIYPKTQADPSYLPNASLYLMETSVGYPDFIVVSKNSKHKAAAMVLADLLLEPEANAKVTAVTGNAYNIDLSKLDVQGKKIFDDMMAAFPEGTAAPPDQLALSAHNVSNGQIAGWLGSAWDAQVVKK
ncbi:MAG: hypothetical protein LBS91_04370 [Clostridiales Family XIII bacterium]|jgi:ABC-type uncharacterized transport system YnjBCD substrate-binding protein|nr:hypothetical protein [Clostridiales Family XIII bacterium]